MGKIKDLQNKKKAARIHSSGAGGGGKGGPVVDKLSQEHPCPNCDRIFKQKGRLQEHIKNKHKEEETADDSAEGSGIAIPQEASDKAPKQGGIRVQDVGTTGGGYFSHKSPKLYLLEWCKKQNRKKPIYRLRNATEGKWTCKVVLPDMQYAAKDIVTFLDREFSAESKEEAEQMGAVAVLANVAGDKGYGRLFPPQHAPLWDTLASRSKARAESRIEALGARERHKEREAAKADRQQKIRDSQVAVVMSQENRDAVEAAVQELLLAGGSETPSFSSLQSKFSQVSTPSTHKAPLPHGFPEENSTDGDRPAMELIQMGFSERRVLEVRGVLGENANKAQLLDWLCLHLPESELPRSMASSSRTNKVEIIKKTMPVSDSQQQEEQDERIDHPAVGRLCKFGYDENLVSKILTSVDLDEEKALELLYENLTGIRICAEQYSSSAEEDSPWQEEVMALEAIYSDEVTFPSPSSVELTTTIQAIDIPNLLLQVDDVTVTLTAKSIGPAYPQEIPLIAFSSPHLPPHILKATTRHVCKKSPEFVGLPMIHELITSACEFLADLPIEIAQGRDLESPTPPSDSSLEQTEVGSENEGSRGMHGGGVFPVGGDVGILKGQGKSSGVNRKREGVRTKPKAPAMSPQEIEIENRRLKRAQANFATDPRHSKMRSVRNQLPASTEKANVIQTIQNNRAVIITGMPGCGKSTQVPQFLLEAAIESGQGYQCNIVCTQPRRISALGLAARVADERGEEVGGVVGYSIRNQTSRSKETRIMYCTTGVLLRRMISGQALSGVSHVLVDEVHERSVEMDLLLLLLKENLKKSKCHKVVLMSATANAEDFNKYLAPVVGSVPILHIPGFTHPVREFLVEEALEMTGFEMPKPAFGGGGGQKPPNKGGGGQKSKQLEESSDEEVVMHSAGKQSKRLLAAMEQMEIGYDMIEAVVAHIVEEESRNGPACLLEGWPEFENHKAGSKLTANGAILIFMPGAMEINRMARLLSESPKINSASVRILPLHASLPAAEQKRVFDTMPKGVRKIVISTNVAETSVTIPDVVAVIDTCLAKEVGYDADRRISRLQLNWVSKASAKQRAGRAGRVRCGVCFRLVTKSKWKNMRVHTPPEITRIPLEALCLNVGALFAGSVPLEQRLKECITPPAPGQVYSAVRTLKEVGALDEKESLTPLGSHIIRMPMDCRVGKMLVYGTMLQCVDPVLTIAAAMSYGRPMFLSPLAKREEADSKRKELYNPHASSKSDHMAIVAAYSAWAEARIRGGDRAGYAFCRENFLSEDVMQATLSARKEFASILADIGFVSRDYAIQVGRGRSADDPISDEFASNSRFVRAALCAGYYPNILRVANPPKKFVQVAGGAKEVDGEAKQVKLFDRERGRVFLHPASVNFSVPQFESGWMVYSDMVETAKVYVRQCSMVPVYGMLVFGGELSVRHAEGILSLDKWANFNAPPKVGVLIKELRAGMGALLNKKIDDPELDLSKSGVVRAVMKLLETDGF
ncbi:hypothetical protein BSKO_09123 [Bryopsis sp. KO-2023]|nr:hypothetical protein BSKO_09123 [Bryopsis sp. KO-2023]